MKWHHTIPYTQNGLIASQTKRDTLIRNYFKKKRDRITSVSSIETTWMERRVQLKTACTTVFAWILWPALNTRNNVGRLDDNWIRPRLFQMIASEFQWFLPLPHPADCLGGRNQFGYSILCMQRSWKRFFIRALRFQCLTIRSVYWAHSESWCKGRAGGRNRRSRQHSAPQVSCTVNCCNCTSWKSVMSCHTLLWCADPCMVLCFFSNGKTKRTREQHSTILVTCTSQRRWVQIKRPCLLSPPHNLLIGMCLGNSKCVCHSSNYQFDVQSTRDWFGSPSHTISKLHESLAAKGENCFFMHKWITAVHRLWLILDAWRRNWRRSNHSYITQQLRQVEMHTNACDGGGGGGGLLAACQFCRVVMYFHGCLE
jgi:hypothetical protein